MAESQDTNGRPNVSGWGYLAGVVLILAGISYGGYVAGRAALDGYQKYVKRENPIKYVEVPFPAEGKEVSLSQPGEYLVFVGLRGTVSRNDEPELRALANAVRVELVSVDDGVRISTSPMSESKSVFHGKQAVIGVKKVEIGSAVQLQVTTALDESDLSADAARAAEKVRVGVIIAKFTGRNMFTEMLKAGLVGGGGVVLGIAAIVVTWVRRSRSRRRVAGEDNHSAPPTLQA